MRAKERKMLATNKLADWCARCVCLAINCSLTCSLSFVCPPCRSLARSPALSHSQFQFNDESSFCEAHFQSGFNMILNRWPQKPKQFGKAKAKIDHIYFRKDLLIVANCVIKLQRTRCTHSSVEWISTLTTFTNIHTHKPRDARNIGHMDTNAIFVFYIQVFLLACLNPISGCVRRWNWQFQIYLNCNRVTTRYANISTAAAPPPESNSGRKQQQQPYKYKKIGNQTTATRDGEMRKSNNRTCRCQENKWNISIVCIFVEFHLRCALPI